MDATIDDLPARITAAVLGALVGEDEAGTSAGAADLLGVAESAGACHGFDVEDLRQRGLERPSRSGSAGLLLRALPFGLLHPLNRPQLRREAYRCIALAGADELTAIAGVAGALLIADLLRFDLQTSLLRVRQSLLEDAPMVLLQRLSVRELARAGVADDASGALQMAITAMDGAATAREAAQAARGGPVASMTLAGALTGAHRGHRAVEAVRPEDVHHGEQALVIAQRLAACASSAFAPTMEMPQHSG